jgi:hypothetical protein
MGCSEANTVLETNEETARIIGTRKKLFGLVFSSGKISNRLFTLITPLSLCVIRQTINRANKPLQQSLHPLLSRASPIAGNFRQWESPH